jgi:hypothetical protein
MRRYNARRSAYSIDSDSASGVLADRYHELMQLRSEALTRFGANVVSTFKGPPSRVYLPALRDRVHNQPPIWRHVIDVVRRCASSLTVLEIGPGAGALAAYLRERFGDRIDRYYGYERDQTIAGPYERIEEFEHLPSGIDLVIASEVAEHMSADDFYSKILVPLRGKLAEDAIFVGSVPNPVAPGGIARDFSHLQSYPWYDLYAILRLEFDDVDIVRTHYLWTIPRFLFLLPRMVCCSVQELDWCDGLVWTARLRRS